MLKINNMQRGCNEGWEHVAPPEKINTCGQLRWEHYNRVKQEEAKITASKNMHKPKAKAKALLRNM
nr:hypothetical protein [Tanacetum cinerariifolium]